jgi:hypothetical protein
MRFLFFLLSIVAIVHAQECKASETQVPAVLTPLRASAVENGCVSFSVSAGTGCAWMCNYCSNQLGTDNYYFTDQVCTYQTGGCVGNPQAGVTYTCCSA